MSFASEEGVFEFVLNTAHTKSESEYAQGFRLVVKGLSVLARLGTAAITYVRGADNF